jgi:hypothetical protein
MNQQANINAWSEKTCHHPGSRIKKCAFCWQSDFDDILGL